MLIYQRPKKEYKGNLHAHTTRSDGVLTPKQVAAAYQAAGYDFLALTDHRTLTLEDGQGLLLIPGMELDFALENSEVVHLLAIGDMKEAPELTGLSPTQAVSRLISQGHLVYLAHPHWSLNRLETVRALVGLSGAEIFNSISRPPYNPHRAEATQILDLLACEGLLLPTLATDDSHFYDKEAFAGFIFLAAEELTLPAVLSALKQGRYYASQGPRFERVEVQGDKVLVECSEVSAIIFHSNLPWNQNRCAVGEGITNGEYALNFAAGERFVRVVIEDALGRKAFMNPFPVR